ncbi:PP2C family protein-serine/threonine phosphatase [Streptomyces sp. NPDC001617]
MPRTRLKRSNHPLEAIEPPRDSEVVAGVLAATALVLVLGVLSESTVWLLGLLVFLPGTASALCTVRQTRFVAAWTTVVVTVAVLVRAVDAGHWFDRLLLVLFTVALGAASDYACHRRIQREHEMLRLRSTAAAMQRHILHPLPLLTDDVLVSGVYEPVQEDRLVGGDIYDVVATPWGTRVLIGDVQGKGLAAVGAAFAVIGAFREAAYREPTLTALVDALDASVVRHNSYAEQTGDDERFVTALVIGVDAGEEVQVVSCGHIPPQVVHEGDITTPVLDTGVPLGLAELSDEPATVGWFPFPAGSTLLLTTDGLTETRAADGAFFPVDERLKSHAHLSPTDLAQALYDDARAFAGHDGQHDDVAVLAVRRSPRR